MVKNNLFFWTGILLLLAFFGRWWINPMIIGGDWPFFYQEAIRDFVFFPPSWSYMHGNGLGGTILSYAIDTYLYLSATFSSLIGLPWSIGSKVFWYLPFVVLSYVSAYALYWSIRQDKLGAMVAGILYTTNTYILMLSIGGQIGPALAYSLIPAALVFWLQFLEKLAFLKKSKGVFSTILSFVILVSLISVFDVRLAYIASILLIITAVFFIVLHTKNRQHISEILRMGIGYGVIALVILGLVQAYWVIPMIFLPKVSYAQLGISENVASSLAFFSFANFSDAISLLHPNWPENIFGKTYFLRVEFLLLPLLAFVSLFGFYNLTHISKKNDTKMAVAILAFSLIALIGSFLGKGAREPFGHVYIWLFQHVPGFILFRDPTKWYLLIAIAYAVLIPLGLLFVSNVTSKLGLLHKKKKYIPFLVFSAFVLYMVILLRPVLFEQPRGTFRPKNISAEYTILKNMLLSDKRFYRTLWVPRQHRFTLATRTHPAVEAFPLFAATNTSELLVKMQSPSTEKILKNAGVKYVVVPYDIEGEIFLKDRKYSEKERQRYVKLLDQISYLTKKDNGKLTIYQVNSHSDLFALKDGTLQYFVDGDGYKVVVNTTKPDTLFFSQSYSPLWQLRLDTGSIIRPKKTKDGFMEFELPKPGMYKASVVFDGSTYYLIGRLITGITVLSLLGIFCMLQLKKS